MRNAVLSIVLLVGCGGVSSDEEAERAYIGLDAMVEKGLGLGMAGYNAADSANIPDQVGDGDLSGTITVGGQVDQGNSDNKELRLDVTLDDYADEIDIDDDGEPNEYELTYATVEAEPMELDLSLRDVPDGTLEGTFVGVVVMDGELEGDVTLDLDITGEIEADPEVTDGVRRVDGSTHISGTVTSDYGEYEVDVTRETRRGLCGVGGTLGCRGSSMRTMPWVSAALVLGAPGFAKTPDGRPPSVETVCDQYTGAAYGLCNSYCEARDCDDPRVHASDRSCAVTAAQFKRKTGHELVCESDPEPSCKVTAIDDTGDDGFVVKAGDVPDDDSGVRLDVLGNDYVEPSSATLTVTAHTDEFSGIEIEPDGSGLRIFQAGTGFPFTYTACCNGDEHCDVANAIVTC